MMSHHRNGTKRIHRTTLMAMGRRLRENSTVTVLNNWESLTVTVLNRYGSLTVMVSSSWVNLIVVPVRNSFCLTVKELNRSCW